LAAERGESLLRFAGGEELRLELVSVDGVKISVTDNPSELRYEHGLGGRLVQGAPGNLRARGLELVPVCPFVADFISGHPQYAYLVATDATLPQ
jgi:uncharacterized protein